MIKMVLFFTAVFLFIAGAYFWLKEADSTKLKRLSKAFLIFSLLASVTAAVSILFVVLF